MKKKCSLKLVIYELRNINGNFMTHFFGIVFPNLMSLLLVKAIGSQAPEEMRGDVATSIMLTMSLVIPLAIMLLGYGAIYSNEVEKGIPLRMGLFGYGGKTEIMAKILAHLIFMTLALLVFGIFHVAVMGIIKPAFSSILYLLVSLYLMGVKTKQLPEVLQKVAKTLPMTYVSNDFIDFWKGGSYNFMPFIQSFIFFGAAAGIILMASFYKNKRTNR